MNLISGAIIMGIQGVPPPLAANPQEIAGLIKGLLGDDGGFFP